MADELYHPRIQNGREDGYVVLPPCKTKGKDGKDLCVWYDCDPGWTGDGITLLLAGRLAKLVGVSTASCNFPIKKVTTRAREMLHVTMHVRGLPRNPNESAKVFAGADKPLLRERRALLWDSDAMPVWGSGKRLGEYLSKLKRLAGEHDTSPTSLQERPDDDLHAVEAMRRGIMGTQKGSCWLICTTMLTNVAMLFSLYGDEVCKHLAGFCFMGGAVGRGNQNSAVEFNCGADPEAAKIVLEKWAPKIPKTVMIPLDLTSTGLCLLNKMDIEALLQASSNSCAIVPQCCVFKMLLEKAAGHAERFSRASFNRTGNFPVHDPIALLYVLAAEGKMNLGAEVKSTTFRTELHRVDVETGSELCAGQTVVDLIRFGKSPEEVKKRPVNVHIAMDMEQQATGKEQKGLLSGAIWAVCTKDRQGWADASARASAAAEVQARGARAGAAKVSFGTGGA
eukprot:g6712.t1